jgi:hypothetical protein
MNALFPIVTVLLIALGALCLFAAMANADRARLGRKTVSSDGSVPGELAASSPAWKTRE